MSSVLVGVFVVLCIALVVLTLYLIYVLRLVKDLFLSVRELIEDVKKEVKPTIQDLRESILETKNLISDVDCKLQKTDKLFEIIEDASKSMEVPTNIATKAAKKTAITISAFLYGIKEGIKTFIKGGTG